MAIHVLHFMCDVNTGTAQSFRDQCLKAVHSDRADEILVHMSSTGGSLHEGFTLYHFLKSLPVKVTVVNAGSVESAAVIAFLGGHHRVVCPFGRFVFHPWHQSFEGSQSVFLPKLEEIVDSLKTDMQRFAALIGEATNGAEDPFDVHSSFQSAKSIGAQAALKHRFAFEVREAKIPDNAVLWWVS